MKDFARNSAAQVSLPGVGQGTLHKNQTLESILDAAECDFLEHGLYDSKIQDIALAAGISRQILYRYYGTKDELYLAVIDRLNRTYAEVLLNVDYSCLDPESAIKEYTRHVFDICHQHRAIIGMDIWRTSYIPDMSKTLTKRAMDSLSDILTRGQDAGIFRKDMDPARFFAISLSFAMGVVASAKTMSSLTKADFESSDAMEYWREFCADAGLRLAADIPRA